MAVVLVRTDDTDGSSDAEEVTFGLGDKRYAIDLAPTNREKLEKALQPFIDKAREVKGGSRPTVSARKGTSSGLSKEELDAVRQWARDNGMDVSDRGRVSQEIRDKYATAHKE